MKTKLALFGLAFMLIVSGLALSLPKPVSADPVSWEIESPYLNLANDFKIALHTHTTGSVDGTYTPTESMEIYKSYGFVAQAITDHNVVTADPGVADIIHISSVEYSPSDGHSLGINVASYFSGTQQQTIYNTSEQGGLSYISHPNVSPATIGWTNAELDAIWGYTGIEIFNGHSGNSLSFNEDKADYATVKDTSILYIAVDDSHYSSDINRGWVELNTGLAVGALTVEEIQTILLSGNYLSMGRLSNAYAYPAHLDITVSGKTVSVTSNITATIEFISANGVEQTNTSITDAVYTADSWSDQYIRIKATVGVGTYSYTYSNPLVYVSTPYEFVGATHVFTGTADASAANDANWNIVGDWTTHTAPPTGANIVFNATSTNKPCTWDLDDSFGAFFTNSDYSGTITQTVNLTCANVLIGGGTVTGSATKWLNCSGDLAINTTATITTMVLRISMTGTGTTIFIPELVNLHSLIISGTTTIEYAGAGVLRVHYELTVTGSCVIETDYVLRHYGMGAFTNTGEIIGYGTFELIFLAGGPATYNWVPGWINASAELGISAAASSTTIYLADDAVFGSSLSVYSEHATNTCTFSHTDNDTLSVAGNMLVGTRAVVIQGTGAWAFGSYVQNGVSSVFTQGGDISSGDITISYGTYTGDATHWVSCSGNIIIQSAATTTITTDVLLISMTGTSKTIYCNNAVSIHSFEVTNSVTIQYAATSILRVRYDMTISGTCTIESGQTLRYYADDTFTNTGVINGAGTFDLVILAGGPSAYSWTPGTINTEIELGISAAASSSVISLATNAVFSSSVHVYSEHATNICTFRTNNKTLSVMNMTITTRAVFNGTASIIGCWGNWDSANGSFESGSSTITMYGDDTYAKLATGESFNIVDIGATNIRVFIDAPSTISFANTTNAITLTPSGPVILTASYPILDAVMRWSINNSGSISYAATGMSSDGGYRVFFEDDIISTGSGSSFSFVASGAGQYEITAWYDSQVSSLIVMTVNMVGLGIIVTVLASYIAPIANDIREKRSIRPEKLTQNLIRTVIFIVVATLMWGVLHTIAIG